MIDSSSARDRPTVKIASARAESWKMRFSGRAAIIRARSGYKSYKSCPTVYAFDRYAEVLEKFLPGMMKYIIGVPPESIEVRLNLQKQGDVLGGLSSE